MFDEQITAAFLSIWMGFALALQLYTTIAKNKVLSEILNQTEPQVQFKTNRLKLAQLIYSLTGLAGVFAFVSLIGDFTQFKGPVFAVGFFSGIALFLLTIFLNKEKESK